MNREEQKTFIFVFIFRVQYNKLLGWLPHKIKTKRYLNFLKALPPLDLIKHQDS